MPRKKNARKCRLIEKQKRLIATRLMQISLLVDDYLYKHKPMSVRSAEAYIHEIAGFKDKCLQDPRSLQVIEKLTRCMKGIIDEQQEMQDDALAEGSFMYQYEDRETSTALSPVYSIVDDDLTQMPEDMEEDTELITAEENNKHVKDTLFQSETSKTLSPVYSIVDDDLTQIPEYMEEDNHLELITTAGNKYVKDTLGDPATTSKPIEIIQSETYKRRAMSLNESAREIIKIPNNSDLYEQEFNIQDAISNLSIKDMNEAFSIVSQNCSQSLLDKFNEPHAHKQVILTTKEINILTTNDVVKTMAAEKLTTDLNSFVTIPTKIVLPTTKQKVACTNNKINTITSNIKEIYKQTTHTNVQKLEKTNRLSEKIPENSLHNKNVGTTKKPKAKTSRKFNKNKDQTSNQSNFKQTKTLPQLVSNKEKNIMQKQLVDTKVNEILVHPKSTTANAAIANTCEITRKNKTQQRTKTYTTYIQDLSWVENLKFVREVQIEEFQPFTDEGFWENCCLPEMFNEEDFNY